MNVVVDTSLVVKWLIREDDSKRAIELLRAWERSGARPLMPGWALAEVTNVLLQYTIDGLITEIDVEDILLQLPRFISMVDTTPAMSSKAIYFARMMGGRSVYDFLFAALADSQQCELWTADAALKRRIRPVFSQVYLLQEI